MNSIEVVKTFITALQAREPDVAAACMADEFIVSGLAPQSIDKSMFLAIQSELNDAMPDFSYNLTDLRRHGDTVEALIRITGTQTGDLSLPMFGIPLICATGLAVDLSQVHSQYLIKDDKIIDMQVETVPGGGLTGLLQQVGSELPVLPRLNDDDDIKRLNESGETSL